LEAGVVGADIAKRFFAKLFYKPAKPVLLQKRTAFIFVKRKACRTVGNGNVFS
jgi:hypothetical protein